MKNLVLIILLCMITLIYCIDIENLEIKEKSKNYDENGNLISFYLLNPQMINSYSCKSYVHLFPDGKLKGIDLQDDTIIHGLSLEAGCRIEFYETGEVHSVLFTKNRIIKNIPIKAYGLEGPVVEFYQNGNLKYLTLSEDYLIQDIPCRAGAFSEIYLHPNGSLQQAELSMDITYKEVPYKSRSILILDDKANVLEVKRTFFLKKSFLDFLDWFL